MAAADENKLIQWSIFERGLITKHFDTLAIVVKRA